MLGPNPPTEAAGAAAAEAVRDSGATAVLAYNDLMAIGLLDGLLGLGVRVPDDLSVVGIDDIALSRLHPAQADHGGHTRRRPPAGRPSTCCCNWATTAVPPHRSPSRPN